MESKIVNVVANGTWTNPEGKVLYKWDYSFENGDCGGCFSDSDQPPHPEGIVVPYEKIVTDKGYTKIKFASEKKNYPARASMRDPVEEAKKQAMIVRQSSVKVAADLVGYGKIAYDDLLIVAQRITDWAVGDAKANKMNEPSDKMPF